MSGLLEIEDLEIVFSGQVAAVRGLSLNLEKGQTHCLVGESGCGKSVSALSILRLLGKRAKVKARKLAFEGQDLLSLSDRGINKLAGNAISMIFQEPMTSLNPSFSIGSQMTEGYIRHKGANRADAMERAEMLLTRVGVTAAGMRLGQFPHQLSGGLRQRVMIAMALMCEPKLLIADEPTTALDVTVQAQILRLLKDIQRDMGLSILLITHDLGVVARVADHVSVMYAGQVVEEGETASLFGSPDHPYTRGLLECIPIPGKLNPGEELGSIPGTVPRLSPGFVGCGFRDRCSHAGPSCARPVAMRPAPNGHLVRCTLPPGWPSRPNISQLAPA